MTVHDDWLHEAACRGLTTDLFVGTSDPRPGLDICRLCNHRTDCLEAEYQALDRDPHSIHIGIIGGTLPNERHDRTQARHLAANGRPEWHGHKAAYHRGPNRTTNGTQP